MSTWRIAVFVGLVLGVFLPGCAGSPPQQSSTSGPPNTQRPSFGTPTSTGRQDRSPQPSSRPEQVVATIDEQPIVTSEVDMHLRSVRPRVGAAPPVSPQTDALNAAIRVKLFAREAQRRGIQVADGPAALVEAHLVQTLIEQELETQNVDPNRISDAEAQQYYDQHQEYFNQVHLVELAAIAVPDLALAEQLLHQADGATDAHFNQLVAQYSTDPASRARNGYLTTVDERREHASGTTPHADPGEKEFTPVAMSLRKVGQAGLAQGSDGSYYVLRATKLEMTRRSWNDSLKLRIKNIMIEERQEHILSALEQQLRRAVHLSINQDALRQVQATNPGTEE